MTTFSSHSLHKVGRRSTILLSILSSILELLITLRWLLAQFVHLDRFLLLSNGPIRTHWLVDDAISIGHLSGCGNLEDTNHYLPSVEQYSYFMA